MASKKGNDSDFLLDYDNNNLFLTAAPGTLDDLVNTSFYKRRVRHRVDILEDNKIIFNPNLRYPDFIKIDRDFKQGAIKYGFSYQISYRLKEFIKQKNLYIRERAKLGIELKTDATKLQERFLNYKAVVDAGMSRKLRDKQMQDSFFMWAMKKSGNFSVPGAGKTASALGVYRYLCNSGAVNKIVMIGPKSSFGSWIDEFHACFDGIEELHVFNLHDPAYRDKKAKLYALDFESSRCNLFLFNYESLGTYVNQITELVRDKCLLVFDEVHRVKKVKGVYARNALNIAEAADWRIALTGTPIPNSYVDLYNLLHLLFTDEYNDYFEFGLTELKYPDNKIQDINEAIQPFFCRTTKDELLVPRPNKDIIIKTVSDKYENEIFNFLYEKYRKNKLVLLIRILQLESDPQMLLESIDEEELRNTFGFFEDGETFGRIEAEKELTELVQKIPMSSKTKQCLETVKDIVSNGKTVIVWCYFKKSIRNLEKLLGGMGINARSIYGEVELDEREKLLNDFRNGKYEVLITNPHTLAESVSLHTVCHDAVYFEYTYNLVHLLQSKDRIHRLGLPDNQYTQYCFMESIYDLHVDGYSMDNKIYNRLKEKEQTMLEAIERHELEPVYTTEEDLELIFGDIE